MITAEVDSRAVMARLDAMTRKEPQARKDAGEDVANEILRLSQAEVPIDEGTLQNSGTVQFVDDAWVVGYHTPYAARLHEHPEYRFQRGRKGKYLEDPIIHNSDALKLKFGEGLKGGLFG